MRSDVIVHSQNLFYMENCSVPRFASAVTWSSGPRPWRSSPTDRRPLQKALKGGYDRTRTRMAMEWGGGGGQVTGSERHLGRQEFLDKGDRWGEGDHENTLPLGGRVLGHVRLYGERGRRGGGHTKDGHHKNPRGTKSDERIVGRKRAGHPETRAGEATVQRWDRLEQRSCYRTYCRIRACLPGPETKKTKPHAGRRLSTRQGT